MNSKQYTLPFAIAIIGYLLTTRKWILFMNKLNPFTGLIVYYTILTITVLLLEYFGLIIAGIKFESFGHTIGTMMIIFAFFITVNWESCFVNMVTKGSCKEVSTVFLQSEDGATYYLWSKLTSDINKLRLLTYVVTPFVLTLIGVNLITEKVTIGLL